MAVIQGSLHEVCSRLSDSERAIDNYHTKIMAVVTRYSLQVRFRIVPSCLR